MATLARHRLAEETAAFTIELADTFVSDQGRTCGKQTIDEHTSPACLQSTNTQVLGSCGFRSPKDGGWV